MRGGKLLRLLQYNDLFEYGFQPLLFLGFSFWEFFSLLLLLIIFFVEIRDENILLFLTLILGLSYL